MGIVCKFYYYIMITADLSNRIRNLRFPLMLAIVTSHSCAHIIATSDIVWKDEWVYKLLHLFAQGGYIGTSVFFFISGFLFFDAQFNFSIYLNKIKKDQKHY